MRWLLGVMIAMAPLATVQPAEVPASPAAGDAAPRGLYASPVTVSQPASRADWVPSYISACDPCGECPCAWARVEGLMWWAQGMRTPPLVTGGAPPAVLYGGSRLNDDLRGGARAEFGVWLCDCRLAIQGSYFFLGPDQSLARFGSAAADQTIGRPFINSGTGQVAFQQVTTPGSLGGFVTVSSATTGIMGADALLRLPLCCKSVCDRTYRFDFLGGYRYFGLNDQLTVRENLAPNAAPFVPGTQLTIIDSFRTENQFHGASLGGVFAVQGGSCMLSLGGRLDFGAMTRDVTISGATRTDVPGLPSVLRPGGLLAQTSNIGTRHSTSFTVIPEIDLRLGCRLTERVTATVGYSFLLLTDVARAGDQIDLVVNPNLLPGAPSGSTAARPAFTLRQTNAWLQGLSIGLTFLW